MVWDLLQEERKAVQERLRLLLAARKAIYEDAHDAVVALVHVVDEDRKCR